MRVVDLRPCTPESFNLYLKGDGHIGNAACYEKGIVKEVDIIRKDPLAKYIDMGDSIESITVDDKRYDPDVHKGKFKTLMAQALHAAELERSISHKCLMRLLGNHEWKPACRNIGRFDEVVAGQMAGNLEKPWDELPITPGFSAVCLFNGWRGFFGHGWKIGKFSATDPEQLRMNKMLKLRKILRTKAGNCELMAMGHIHDILIVPPSSRLALIEKDGKMKQTYTGMVKSADGFIDEKSRWFISSGSCLKTYDDEVITYGEIAGYDPAEMGMVKVVVRKGKIVDAEAVYV
jgi:hypothetical protein